ncbi:MAG: hypothetical protein LUD81_06000 [Clostridiales bacterium]|nr:hypothetical protein [Clostridiales bacterium]
MKKSRFFWLLKDYDLVDIVMVCLGRRESENYKSCLKLFDVITASNFSAEEKLDIMKEEFNIKITKNIEEKVTAVCNMSCGIEKRAEKKA